MAFSHSKKARVYGGGIDLSPFLRSAGSAGSADTAETSTLGSDDKTFLNGMIEGTLTLDGIFSASADPGTDPDEVSDLFDAALGSTDVVVCHLPQGEGFGNKVNGFSAIQSGVEVSSPTDDVVQVSGELQSNTGLKVGHVLHAKGVESAGASQSTNLDNTLGTTKGGAGFLQVFNIDDPGVDEIDVIIQHSPDNSVWSDLITFTTADVVGAQAIVLPDPTTVARHIRVRWTVSTGGAVTFHASFARR